MLHTLDKGLTSASGDTSSFARLENIAMLKSASVDCLHSLQRRSSPLASSSLQKSVFFFFSSQEEHLTLEGLLGLEGLLAPIATGATRQGLALHKSSERGTKIRQGFSTRAGSYLLAATFRVGKTTSQPIKPYTFLKVRDKTVSKQCRSTFSDILVPGAVPSPGVHEHVPRVYLTNACRLSTVHLRTYM